MAIIRQKYEGQLDGLIKDLRRLGLRVYFNINNALVSFGEEKKSFARQTIEKDKEINHLDHEINEKVIMLITRQQPIANDNYVFTRLKTMGKLAMLMLEDLNNAIRNKDLPLIKEVIERDEDIDDLYVNIVNTSYLIDNDPFVAGQAHLAARHLERIGDHISNIAESVYYYLTGQHFETFD